MEIMTTSRRFKLTPEIKDLVRKRIEKLERYSDQILEAHLILEQEKYRHIAELTLHAPGTELVSREETPEMVTSIDRVVDRMERQLKRLNARMKDRKSMRPVPAQAVLVEPPAPTTETEPAEEEFGPVVIRGDQFSSTPLSVEDAIRMMREKNWDFLLFPETKSGKTCLVHLREDGNFGLVEVS